MCLPIKRPLLNPLPSQRCHLWELQAGPCFSETLAIREKNVSCCTWHFLIIYVCLILLCVLLSFWENNLEALFRGKSSYQVLLVLRPRCMLLSNIRKGKCQLYLCSIWGYNSCSHTYIRLLVLGLPCHSCFCLSSTKWGLLQMVKIILVICSWGPFLDDVCDLNTKPTADRPLNSVACL